MAFSISSLLEYFQNDSKSISRGENHYESGHVTNFKYAHRSATGKVAASMKKKEYKVTIYFTDNLDIESTQCECPRGDYRCSHAAALYFFCKNNVSKTDMECNWKKARMTAGCDIKSTDELFLGDNFRALQGTVTDEDRSWLFNELQTQASFTGMCWLMSPEPSTSMPDLPVIDNLVSSSGFKDALDKRHYFKHHFALSPEAISKIGIKQLWNPLYVLNFFCTRMKMTA